MAEGTIDLDRGVIYRSHATGLTVYMYADAPGVYLNAFSKELPEQIAAEAGFDTAKLGRERLKREALASAMAEIEAQFNPDGAANEVIDEANGFQLVARGNGLYHIADEDGGILTKKPMAISEARLVFNKLTGVSDEKAAAPADPAVETDPAA